MISLYMDSKNGISEPICKKAADPWTQYRLVVAKGEGRIGSLGLV